MWHCPPSPPTFRKNRYVTTIPHFPFVHNYVTPFLATTMSLPFLSANNYTPLPVRQEAIRHFLSAKKLYATSCPPRSYMPLPVRQQTIRHFLSAKKLYVTLSPRPQLYPPTHSYILPSTTVRRCLAHPPLVDKIRYTTTIYVTISAGHRRTKNRYRLVTSHNITSRGPPPGSKKIRYM